MEVTASPPWPPLSSLRRPLYSICPYCQQHSKAVDRYVHNPSRNGNLGRPYYSCGSCNHFRAFTDDRGLSPHNPHCECARASRLQVAGPDRVPAWGLHFVCAKGLCDFYSNVVWNNGARATLNGVAEVENWKMLGLI